MTLRGHLRLGLSSLVISNLVLGLITIALLSRLGPAFRRVQNEDRVTLDATEDMLAVFAEAGGQPLTPAARERFTVALRRLRDRGPDNSEDEALSRVAARIDGAFEGDLAAVHDVVAALTAWITEHRLALQKQERELERLAVAGAWFLVFLTVFFLAGSIIVSRVVDARALLPLEELFRVIRAARAGDLLRRSALRGAPSDLRRTSEALNSLLESLFDRTLCGTVPPFGAERAALLDCLDQHEFPTFVLDRTGEVVVANRAGLELLSGDAAVDLRERLSARTRAGGEDDGRSPALRSRELPGGAGSLCWAEAEAAEAESEGGEPEASSEPLQPPEDAKGRGKGRRRSTGSDAAEEDSAPR